jgi:hypothetical protein
MQDSGAGRVADQHRFNAAPDPAFHVNTDPDPTYHFNADLDPNLLLI